MTTHKPSTIDKYIDNHPPEVREILCTLRHTIHEKAPDAAETINYGIPTFKLQNKNLVHFAAYKKHIGFYPSPSGIEAFADELAKYESSKGSVKFPIDLPLPLDLVQRIVAFRVSEILGE